MNSIKDACKIYLNHIITDLDKIYFWDLLNRSIGNEKRLYMYATEIKKIVSTM